MKLMNILILVGGLILGSAAQAGFLIEPYLGTYNLKKTLDGFGADDGDEDVNSKSIMGARLGYGVLGLSAGAEYSVMKTDDEDMTATGVFVKYEFPIMFQVFATYFTSVKSGNDILGTGTGTKIGIGYTGLPFLSINLEVIAAKFDDIEGLDDAELAVAGTALTISLPLDF